MNNQAQLLLVSGLLMAVTLIAVSSTITHSVNLGAHQADTIPNVSIILLTTTNLAFSESYNLFTGKVL